MSLDSPRGIFALRNNDLGDVLVVTPLLHGLKKAFPTTKVAIGVGDWARPLLENNTDIDEIIPCNAPWHNKQNCRFPANSPRTFLEGLSYVLFSKEARNIRKARFTHGIDILGSRQGAWLLRRAGIPYRFGVQGYAGGDTWCKQCIDFKEDRKVADAALAFLPLMGTDAKVEPRPRIFLTREEKEDANLRWGAKSVNTKRIIIAPGGGFPEKCWGNTNFSHLSKLMLNDQNYQIRILGSKDDQYRIQVPGIPGKQRIQNLCGKLSLRQSTAMVSQADFVVTNTSLCMHLAGAFTIPSLTLLGEWYDSAILHHQQWAYPEGIVIGKEVSVGRRSVSSVRDAFDVIRKSSSTTFHHNQ
ncbi:glycosyltransferase family 9 protein [Opitutales bacterium]|nr:glycosyltransferase family 9 protein [Opitutales bacterium]